MRVKVKKAEKIVVRKPRYTSQGILPLRIEVRKVKVARGNLANIKKILNNKIIN